MTTRLKLDKAGRVVLPTPLRDELELAAGDTLELESRGEQITLRPVRGAVPLQKERGIRIVRTGWPLTAATTDQTLRQIREERDREQVKAFFRYLGCMTDFEITPETQRRDGSPSRGTFAQALR